MKKYTIHLCILSISAIILGLGCVFFIQAMLGSDAMTSFSQGLSMVLPFSLSTCYAGLNFVMFFIALIFDKQQVGLGTLIFPIISAKAIDIGMLYIPSFHRLRFLAFLLGLILIAFAVALASKTECGKNPNDAMNFALMKLSHLPYNILRAIVDALMLITGILLGGQWGIGTVLAVCSIGTIALYFMNWIDQSPFFNQLLLRQKR